jgi:hypothetical protein
MIILDPVRIADVSFYVERSGRAGWPDTFPGAGPIEMFYLSVSMNVRRGAVAGPMRSPRAFSFPTLRT